MCGIFGVWSENPSRLSAAQLEKAAYSLRHRGPDDEGYFFYQSREKKMAVTGGFDTPPAVMQSNFPYSPSQNIQSIRLQADLVLANRRLAILDLSPAGHQPMCTTDQQLWITYNGEIYNYLELRKELADKGHRFHTETDTEVLLAAYREWGDDFVNRLNGMWAFAIADLKRELLFCSRDRTGVKPFYYFYDNDTFAFASEIKSILQLSLFEIKPNEKMVWDYFVLNQVNHTDETFYQRISVLPPGHNLLYPFGGGLTQKRYWDFPTAAGKIQLAEAIEKFKEALSNAVTLRLRSDVPVGSCLSGGIDSSSIVLLVKEQKAFTAIFEDERYNDREYVDEVVRKGHVDAFQAFPTAEDLWKEAGSLMVHQEEPFLSSSIYAQYALMKKVKETNVKVLLDGQGGDELLAGYTSYYYPFWADLLKAKKFGKFFKEFGMTYNLTHQNLMGLAFLLFKELVRRTPTSRPYYAKRTVERQADIVNTPFLNQYSQRALDWLTERSTRNLNEQLINDSLHGKLPALLRYEDRNSMAFSIEARVPFADDRELLEFTSPLPSQYKIRNGRTKFLLREAMKGILPDRIRLRPDKKGFDTPEVSWMKKLQKPMQEIILQQDDPYLKKSLIGKNFTALSPAAIWKIFCFKLWWNGLTDR